MRDVGRVVSDRGHTDEYIVAIDAREHGVRHLCRARGIDALDARWGRHCRRARNDGHFRSGLCGGLRQGESHFARTGIGNSAHRVDRFERGTGGEENTLSCKHFWLTGSDQRSK